jgi:hypothetical protein
MTGKQPDDSLIDETLTREIEDLLSINPSTEFLARIRSQVARESSLLDRPALGPRKRWFPASIGIAAMAAVVLVVLHRPARETPQPVRQAESEEIVTGFFSLMENPPPFERGLLVRMTVPASTMRAVGLPIGDDHLSDPVEADLLVGQDDLTRAIRFVSYRKIRK